MNTPGMVADPGGGRAGPSPPRRLGFLSWVGAGGCGEKALRGTLPRGSSDRQGNGAGAFAPSGSCRFCGSPLRRRPEIAGKDCNAAAWFRSRRGWRGRRLRFAVARAGRLGFRGCLARLLRGGAALRVAGRGIKIVKDCGPTDGSSPRAWYAPYRVSRARGRNATTLVGLLPSGMVAMSIRCSVVCGRIMPDYAALTRAPNRLRNTRCSLRVPS